MMLWPHLLLPLIFALLVLPASAQVSAPQDPVTALPKQPSGETSSRRYSFETNVTGDWFGLRNGLSERGIEITGSYVMEFLGNPVGGKNRGSTYVHNIILQGDFNLEKLIDLPNSAFRVLFSQRSGDSLTNDHIGARGRDSARRPTPTRWSACTMAIPSSKGATITAPTSASVITGCSC